MKRILIIGPTGAGKTTLAKKISNKLKIPHTELDSIYHQKNWQPINNGLFREIVYDIAGSDQWIMCGNYYSKLGAELWDRADTVIWCDYSFPLVFKRLFMRTMRRGIKKQELWNGNTECLYIHLFTKDSLFLWLISSWKRQKHRYSLLFFSPERFPTTKLISFKNPKQAEKFIDTL
ncbi:MAG: AAA family ATPase [Candidatus Saccharimonadales bacterium]